MKIPVKVKATGEIVDVTISVAVAGNPLYTTSGGVTYLGDDIEPAEPDWQQVRIQFISAALTGLLANPDSILNRESIVEATLKIADALIEELKGGNNETE